MRTCNIAIAVLFVAITRTCFGQTCVKVDTCKCDMSDNTGRINLRSLASSTGAARFTVDGGDGWLYNYNPCLGFNGYYLTGLAIQQASLYNNWDEYNLGSQSSERFEHSIASGTSIKYEDDPYFPVRNSSVLLICNRNAREHVFQFLGELITTEYEFLLQGPCACPGGCDDYGIIEPTTTTPPPPPPTQEPDEPNNCIDCDSVNSGMNWSQVGADLVSLIFHDLILICLIGCTLAICIYVFKCSFNCADKGKDFTDKTSPNVYSEA